MALYNSPTAPDGRSSGILGLTSSNVTVARSGRGTNADRLTVTISGFQWTWVTFGWAGTHSGKPIMAATPVEN